MLHSFVGSGDSAATGYCILRIGTNRELARVRACGWSGSSAIRLWVRLFFVGGPRGFCERHGNRYLTRRRRGGEGGGGGSLSGGAVPGRSRIGRSSAKPAGTSRGRRDAFRTKEVVRGLGATADVPLTAARQAAVRLRAGLLDGAVDLPRRGRAVRAIVHTWREVFNRLRRRKVNTLRGATLRAQDFVWRVHVGPVFGSRDVTKTTTEGVVDAINVIDGSAQPKGSHADAGARLAVCLSAGSRRTWRTARSTRRSPGPRSATAAATTAPCRTRRSAPGCAQAAGPIAELITVLVLTAARLEDVRSMTWDEVDGDTWTVSGERHKSGADFTIPLTAPVLAILELQRGQHDRFVFRSMRVLNRPISAKVIRAQMHAEYNLHGFRGSFKGWAAETAIDDCRRPSEPTTFEVSSSRPIATPYSPPL